MKIIVIGATGTIGKEVVKLLQANGHEVVAASRSSQPSVDFTNAASIDAFYNQVEEVDAIITVAGDAAFVALDKLTDADIQLSLQSKLMGQINMVRKGLSKLRPNGVFVITGGFLAYAPAPQTAMITMVNAGLEGFAKAAALDLTEGRRIVIVHPPWVAETAAAIGMDASPWPSAAEVAETYLQVVEGKETGQPVFVEGYAPA
ncbi:short chain dehydrogenase [Adhaeribacter radiodurans]|uniref:Short chain dehydrogenase n=1 Tax=Adhaeribacter radiodurans TaxID=2745197 RepID=A0A7L7LF57_9BACT|nr:short chain dehydrogenase [Adhaeribacter radiodurans]QMU31387.1 short chain dehydrogenase [Adhaeribacter radiodurans]